jgi:hypothetical protein
VPPPCCVLSRPRPSSTLSASRRIGRDTSNCLASSRSRRAAGRRPAGCPRAPGPRSDEPLHQPCGCARSVRKCRLAISRSHAPDPRRDRIKRSGKVVNIFIQSVAKFHVRLRPKTGNLLASCPCGGAAQGSPDSFSTRSAAEATVAAIVASGDAPGWTARSARVHVRGHLAAASRGHPNRASGP